MPPTVPVQVERIIPAHDMVTRPSMEVTNYWWNLLPSNSVLRNYMLVSTQWPSVPRDGVTGDPFPPTLANTVIETYMQDTAQGSCIDCHALARTQNKAYPADFSFMLNAATKPQSKTK